MAKTALGRVSQRSYMKQKPKVCVYIFLYMRKNY